MIKIKTGNIEIEFETVEQLNEFVKENELIEKPVTYTTEVNGFNFEWVPPKNSIWITSDGNGNWVEDKKIQEEIDKGLLND